MASDPKSIIKLAEQYRRAAIVLEGDPNSEILDRELIIPNALLSALSFELYLKALHLIELEREAPNIHDLEKLFGRLSEDARSAIQSRWEVANPTKIEMRTRLGIEQMPFSEALQKVSNLFTRWRYHYQFDQVAAPGDGLQIGECTRWYIYGATGAEYEDVRLPLPNGWRPPHPSDRVRFQEGGRLGKQTNDKVAGTPEE